MSQALEESATVFKEGELYVFPPFSRVRSKNDRGEDIRQPSEQARAVYRGLVSHCIRTVAVQGCCAIAGLAWVIADLSFWYSLL